jgi:hypothetical protein
MATFLLCNDGGTYINVDHIDRVQLFIEPRACFVLYTKDYGALSDSNYGRYEIASDVWLAYLEKEQT